MDCSEDIYGLAYSCYEEEAKQKLPDPQRSWNI